MGGSARHALLTSPGITCDVKMRYRVNLPPTESAPQGTFVASDSLPTMLGYVTNMLLQCGGKILELRILDRSREHDYELTWCPYAGRQASVRIVEVPCELIGTNRSGVRHGTDARRERS